MGWPIPETPDQGDLCCCIFLLSFMTNVECADKESVSGQGPTLYSYCHALQESKLCHLQSLDAAMCYCEWCTSQIRRGTASQSCIQRHIRVLPGQAWAQQSRAAWV